MDVLKVDVQGFETAVLEGAQRLVLDNPHMKAVIEYWPYGLSQGGRDPAGLLGLLDDPGAGVRGQWERRGSCPYCRPRGSRPP